MSLSVVLISFFISFARAEEAISPLLPSGIAKDVEDIQKKSEVIQEKERELLADLYRMSNRQRKLASQKSKQLQKREELEADVAELEKDIEQVSLEIVQLKKKIVRRMRNLHKVSAPTIFQSIFGAHDITEMDRNARIMYKISKADVEELRTFRGLKNLLSQQQQSLQSKIAEFEKNQKKLERQELAIKATYQAQSKLLQQLEQQDKTILSKLRNMKNQDPRVQRLFANGIYEKKGMLDLPTDGLVTQRFGLLKVPAQKIRIYHKGWFLSTAPQKPVKNVSEGVIVFANELPEQNKVVIIDHGDHFYSVYANLSEIFVFEGEKLQAETVLGSSGLSRFFGHGLYFEMRHFSQSEDPAEWFKNSAVKISSLKEQNI